MNNNEYGYVTKERLEELQGNLSDKDYEQVGHVIEKQDIYSKSSRKHWLTQKMIMPLIIYNFVIFIGLFACFAYATYYFFNKPSPLFLYENENGAISCARAYVKENGKLVAEYTSKQKEICLSLKKYER